MVQVIQKQYTTRSHNMYIFKKKKNRQIWIRYPRLPLWPLIDWHTFDLCSRTAAWTIIQTWHKCSLWGSVQVLLRIPFMWIRNPRWRSGFEIKSWSSWTVQAHRVSY